MEKSCQNCWWSESCNTDDSPIYCDKHDTMRTKNQYCEDWRGWDWQIHERSERR